VPFDFDTGVLRYLFLNESDAELPYLVAFPIAGTARAPAILLLPGGGYAFRSEGYRRMTFMMLDEDIVAVSPPSVYRVLSTAGLLDPRWRRLMQGQPPHSCGQLAIHCPMDPGSDRLKQLVSQVVRQLGYFICALLTSSGWSEVRFWKQPRPSITVG
jgi:hypothetical protein